MLNRYAFTFIGALLCAGSFAQERTLIGIRLAAHLKHADPSSMVDLFLQGNSTEVELIARAHGGHVKMSMRNWTSVRMPAGRVAELNNEFAVRSIEISGGRPRTMNDSMRVKTHIDWIHQGLAPLPHPYDGQGVIMGFVDTGIDFNHPDFSDDNGTRVLHYWDHNFPPGTDTPQPYGYGQEWDKAEIDAGNCPAGDTNPGGHGTTVAGTAAGNGGATGAYIGAAPKSELIIVSSDLSGDNLNWTGTVADGVKYIFDHATELGRPAVVNLSLGDYLGSHDGFDPAALMIDSMLQAAPGRSVVAAAGNSYCFGPYQLRMEVDGDTSFAWIKTNPNSVINGGSCAYIDFWADTTDLNDVWYSIGADKVTGGYSYRGRIPFRNVQGAINTLVEDTLYSVSGHMLGIVSTFASVRGGQYHLEMGLLDPDSASYNWRIMMTGDGRADAWGDASFGLSQIVSGGIPTEVEFPDIANIVLSTVDRGIVDSWACSPHVITVANYNNELSYLACDGTTQTIAGTEGALAGCTSVGLTRTDQQKPDLAAPGDVTFSATRMDIIDAFVNGSGIFKLSADCMHVRSGGTSIASPAVAGAAALYLQKCPFASHTQVKDAIVGAAFTDSHTGAVPSARWGWGKLDAYTPMIATNFSASATGDADPFCEGDSALAQGQPGFAMYFWSDGSTGQDAWSQGEPLVLTVIDDLGCAAGTDTLFFNTLPLPPIPIITPNGLVLTSTPADGYQWFLDGSAIPGATGQSYTSTLAGEYTVMITDANGCSSMSEPYALALTMAEGRTVDLRLWPVPAHDQLYVTNNETGVIRYEIVDAEGRSVRQGLLRGRGTSVIDLAGLVPGAYSMNTQLAERTRHLMFIVE